MKSIALLTDFGLQDHYVGVVRAVLTNLPAHSVPDSAMLKLGAAEITCKVGYYSEAPPGVPVMLEGSSGLLEVAIADDSAAARLGVEQRAKVAVKYQ